MTNLIASVTLGNQRHAIDRTPSVVPKGGRRGHVLLGSSALATALISSAAGLSFLPASSAFAACVNTGGSNWSCSGTNTSRQAITQNNASVSTSSGFAVTNNDPTFGNAVEIRGTGAVSYTDNNKSSLTSGVWGSGLDVAAGPDPITGAGSVTINANGAITANVGSAVTAGNGGSGTTSITLSGAISGSNGIWATDGGSGLMVRTSGTVTGTSGNGIVLDNRGKGATLLNASGDITASSAGIFADNEDRSTDLTVNAVNVSGGYAAIHAFNRGTGNTEVSATGKLTATGAGSKGIIASNESFASTVAAKNLTVNAVDIEAGTGVWAMNGGVGDTTITTTGTVTATEADGIWAVAGQNKYGGADGAQGTLAVTVNNVTAVGFGVYAANQGVGDANVTVTGTLTGGSDGIYSATEQGSSTIAATNVTGKRGSGINAATKGGDIGITTSGLVQGSQAAITVSVEQGRTAAAILNGTTQNLSGASTALAIKNSSPGAAEITNRGLLTGVVDLAGGPNRLTNAKTWDTAGGTNNFGGQPASSVNNQGLVIAGGAGAASPVTTTFQGLGTFNNSGTLAMGNGVAGDRTVISGNYHGNGGTITLDTVLGSDDSVSDMLVIDGGQATGTTRLDIVNTGGAGAVTQANGIKVVDAINGATTEAGSFSLAHAVGVDAFDYGLYRSSLTPSEEDQNWYLRSTGKLTPDSQTALPYADVLSQFAQSTLGTLQQRAGNRIWPNGGTHVAADLSADQVMRYAAAAPVIHGQGAWGRVVGEYTSYAPQTGSAYTQAVGFLQAGYEGAILEGPSGDLTLGAYATIGTSKAEIDISNDPVTGARRGKGKITTAAYDAGANLTWLGRQGLYADMIGQLTWYDSDLSSKTGGKNAGWSTALSLEVGQRIEMDAGWAIVPQAQLAWAHVDFTAFTDSNGARVAIDDGDSLKGRLGLRVENLTSWTNAAGGVDRLQLYGIANLSYQFLQGTSVEVAGTALAQRNRRLWGEAGLGATYAWNDKWSLHGETGYAAALTSGSGDNYTVKGSAGLRYHW
ncbi:autotransporter family protein [Labrys neptuniae]